MKSDKAMVVSLPLMLVSLRSGAIPCKVSLFLRLPWSHYEGLCPHTGVTSQSRLNLLIGISVHRSVCAPNENVRDPGFLTEWTAPSDLPSWTI